MRQHLAAVAVTVRDYDEAIDFYVTKLGFELVEDTRLTPEKRWVRVRPPGSDGACILLAKAVSEAQSASVGNQTGGRVFLFLHTDDFWRDYRRLQSKGVRFLREPAEEDHGTATVFEDLYGNKWDLIEPRAVPQA